MGASSFRDDETRDLLGDVDRWTIAEAATLAVDEENAGATWWDAVYEADDIPAAMRQMVYGRAPIPVHAADLPDPAVCPALAGTTARPTPASAHRPLTPDTIASQVRPAGASRRLGAEASWHVPRFSPPLPDRPSATVRDVNSALAEHIATLARIVARAGSTSPAPSVTRTSASRCWTWPATP